jgi:ADP-ribose pyrophosphatase
MSDLPHVVSSTRAFYGRVFNVRIDELRYDDGSQHRIDVVEHGASFTIVATPNAGELVLVRQHRHAAGAALWEIPAGRAEAGEDPFAGAARELREETGYRAGRMRPLGSLYTTPGFCDEIMHFFHADELEAGEQALDDDERIEVRTFAFDAAWRLVADGAIADCKTVLALLWTRAGRDELGGGFGR